MSSPPSMRVFQATLLVKDYDEAKNWYCERLSFECIEDTVLGEGKRWVRIAPPGTSSSPSFSLLLAKASDEEQQRAVGNQAGGKVMWFLETDDLARDFEEWREKGVKFVEDKPRDMPYGMVVVMIDLYGNKWDIIQPKKAGS